MTMFNISGSSAVQEPLTTSETKSVPFTISITGMGGPPDSASITWTASSQSGDTATANVDYQALSGTVNLGPSQTSQVIQIPIYYDVLSEPNETFRVTLSSPTNGATIMSGTAYGTIIDAPVNPMYVSITADLSQIIEGESVNFRIARSDTTGPLTVYFQASGTATTADYTATPAIGSVTFANGQSEVIVAIAATDDGQTESLDTLTLELLTTAPGTQGPAQYLISGAGSASVGIQDPPPPTVWVESAAPVDEGASRQVTFYRSTSTGSLNLLFNVAGTATLAADYSLSASGSVTFNPGATQAVVTLDAAADDLPEGDEVVNFTIVLPGQGPAPYIIGTPGGVAVAIFDTSGYHVNNFTVDWQKPDESWQSSPDNEMLWEEDLLRFTADINSGALPFLIGTEWYKRPFGSTGLPWERFAVSPTPQTGPVANLFVGDWEIKVDALFAHVVAQSPPKHRPLNGIRTAWEPGDDDQRFFYAEEDVTDYPNHYGPRVYPERNSAGDETIHNKVNVKVTLAMAPPLGFTATVHLKAYDPDHVGQGNWANRFDRNDFTADIDDPPQNRPEDNRVGDSYTLELGGQFDSTNTRTVDVTIVAGATQKSEAFTIDEIQPGNNYKVAGLGRQEWLDVLFFAEDGVDLLWPRTFFTPLPDAQATHVMTVWRTLHAELDTMVAPGAGFAEDEVVGDDLLRDMHELDLGFATHQFKRAMVDLVDDLKTNDPNADPNEFDTTDGITFIHHVDLRDKPSRDAFLAAANQKRNVPCSVPFWVVHVVGAYEGAEDMDFDKFTEGVMGGWSYRSLELAWVYEETLRDRGAYTEQPGGPPVSKNTATLEKRVALHEIAHVMGNPHGGDADGGPLDPEANLTGEDIDNYFRYIQLANIQTILKPGNLLPGQPPDPP